MRSATVWMHNQVAGRLIEALSGEVVFEYEPGYAAQPQAHPPISRTIPLASRGTAGLGLHPFFEGLIP
jgi:HipA-like protein